MSSIVRIAKRMITFNLLLVRKCACRYVLEEDRDIGVFFHVFSLYFHRHIFQTGHRFVTWQIALLIQKNSIDFQAHNGN